MNLRFLVVWFVISVSGVCPGPLLGDEQTARPSETFVPIFNGRDLAGWYTFLQKHGKDRDPDRVITIEDGSIHLYKHAAEGSAVVMGYIATNREFENYHLRFQYRWGTKKFRPRYALKRDAGFYYHITGRDAIWPTSLQFQVQQTDVGDLLAIGRMQLDTWLDPSTRDAKPATYQDPEKGGQRCVLGGTGVGYQKRLPGDFEVEGWNTAEVIAVGDTTVHLLNGHHVNQGRGIRLADADRAGTARPVTRGRIALEIEAAEIFYRNVEIRPMPASFAPGP
jgi:hypothetical protein